MELSEKLVRGEGRFVDDIQMPGMLYLGFARSQYARAKILKISGAQLTHKEVNFEVVEVGEGATTGGPAALSHPVLANGHVGYVGQPVAAVYSDDRYVAEDLIDSVEIEYEPMKAIVDPEDSLKREVMYPGVKSNAIVDRYFGKEFTPDPSDIVIERKIINRRIATNPIEPRGIVAAYDGHKLTVWVSTQSAHSIKGGLSEALKMEPDRIRVVQVDTGGAFGLKGGLFPEYVVACYLAMKEKRPVKWIETRREHLLASRPGRGVVANLKLYAKKDGTITGLKGEVIVDNGAFTGGSGEFSPIFITRQLAGAYYLPNAYVRAVSVLTNKAPQGPYRGAGRPEAMYFIERLMDGLADKLKMDPVALRLINAAKETYTSPLGMQVEKSRQFLESAIKELNYEKYRDRENVGFAFLILYHATAGGESARIKVENGRLKVWTGGNAHGQRHDIFIKTLLKEELGVPEDLVDVLKGDTDQLEDGVGAWGSRSSMVLSSAVIVAAGKIKEQIGKKHGKYTLKALLEGKWDEYEFFKYDKTESSLGANLVTVDMDSYGRVIVKECLSYYDIGRILDLDNAKGQNAGGAVQGIGQTLSEELAFDEDGLPLITSISDAGVLSADLVPKFGIKFHKSESPLPSKAKGIGEAPTIGVPIALSRAIEKATGKLIVETPIRPEYLLPEEKA